ncbi:MAG: glycyl-radical enzyme activating protein [Oscillospiraceae bacterium]|nr:glycyl-radical enzyme activating protein [Oscillospiraceae bacterium]
MKSALVTNIQGYSIHDGPGIRTVVFLKGCPLRCKWCANPENLEDALHIGFIKNLCTGCGRCAKACPNGAILAGPDKRIDRERCVRCGECVKACYYEALVRYGDEKTSQEVFEQVRKDKMFYESSGGGVTVSGGEPLTHADFVAELFALCREDGINTCVETCGCVPRSAIEKVADLTDTFYFDLKLMDPLRHRHWTGADNALILDNARYLAGRGASILFRQPLIPGVNSMDENVRATAEFIRSLGRDDLAIQIMPYHRMGTSKYAALDKPYELENIQIMDAESVGAVEKRYLDCGVKCTVSK